MKNNVKTNDGLKLIVGTEHNDTLIGTSGIDIVIGLGGDDWIEGKQGADTLDGGAGKDTASYSSSSVGVTVDLTSGTGKDGDAEGDKLTNIENIVGSDFDDILIGYNHEMTKAKGNEFLINNNTENCQKNPSVASLKSGGFVVTWDSHSQDSKKQTNTDGVFGQRYDADGQKVGNEFQINTYVENYQSRPSITGLTGGGFIVAWNSKDQDGSSWGVYGQCYNENGDKLGAEFQVNTYTAGTQWESSVASLQDGGFIVIWDSNQRDGSDLGVYGQRYDENGRKVSSEFQVNTYTKGKQYSGSVAGLAGGGFIVTWHSCYRQHSSAFDVYGQHYDKNGNRVGSEFLVNTYTKDNQSHPSVTGLEDGGFIVIWNSDQRRVSGSDETVYGQRYDANSRKVGSEFQVNTYTKGSKDYAEYASVAGLAGGGFIVTWQSYGQDGSGYGIYGQRYDTHGAKIDEEFRINTHTQDHQKYPSVSSLPNAQFVVTWESKGQDNDYDREGSGSDCGGIYGQLYETNRNSLIGGNGNDILEGKGGADILDGGEGIDTVLYNNSPAGIVVNLASGTGQGGDAERDILKNVEKVVGTKYNDIITGDDNANILEGRGGDDILTGGQGSDVFVVSQEAGNVIIKDFEIAKDKIDISFCGTIKSFKELLNKVGYKISDQGGNTEITLDFHHKITLINVDPSTLQASQFIFVKEPKPELEAVSEFKKVAVHIAKVGQADKIIIERDTRADQHSAVATDLEQCKNVILNFNPLEGDTIDLSYYGKFNVDQVSFTTFTSVTTSTNQIPVSGIKISGEEDYVACVYGFDADKFFAPDYVDPDTGAPNMLNPHDVITLLQAQNFHGEL